VTSRVTSAGIAGAPPLPSPARQACDVLLAVLAHRRPELRARAREVGDLAVAVGQTIGVDGTDLDDLGYAAELHDVGMMAIPDATLDSPTALTDQEWDLVLQHTIVGQAILAAAPALQPAGRLVRSSHERWDGGGYPDGLAGGEIPLGSRVIFACGVYIAMTSDRPHCPRVSHTDAIEELRRRAGTQFDPAVIGGLIDLFHPARAPFPAAVEAPA
jgi:HD-GYP domain-containing protein (c-di-GMP phosphodiesterase class II)